ncbi:hypothetical protein ASG01_08640 [Chryseobacterium sp. Leaf180]|uniref:DUF5996 family protein n=1 Tax=Chryseobacterium sp. Leaf180 TaxID=1736289 RepID=UPI0006F483FF|nr:DUF5996 family protein [Chryseobacterium sp. Leaf180]KQR93255.1 hypothetical protein ASG01_08640 [Chryseobacterium sp. Leaf180]
MEPILNNSKWPALDFYKLENTLNTVQLWTQIIGKIRMKKTPWINHSWHVTLYVSSSGLTTGSIPYKFGIFEMVLNFISHELNITTSNGQVERIKLQSGSIADFYQALFGILRSLEIEVEIFAKPNELQEAIPFDQDQQEREYNEEEIQKYWKALIKIHEVFTRFRSGFTGKVSPVHFFWGAFDLAVSRFSGKPAPKIESVIPNMPQLVMQEAYSHEVSSCGFWAGSKDFPEAFFYSYVYPAPDGFADYEVLPKEAFFSKDLGEFLLPYKAVQSNEEPEKHLLSFLESTFQAASVTGNWDQGLQCNLKSFEKF